MSSPHASILVDVDRAAQRWPDALDVPGDLSEDFVHAWALRHVSRDIRRLAEEPSPPWPEDVPARPRSAEEMKKVLTQLDREPCVLRTVWLAAYLCALWERALARYEDALVMGGEPRRQEEAKTVVMEIQDALTKPPVSLGAGFFGRIYGDLAVRRARLDALELARVLAGKSPLPFRDADPLSLMVAAQRARANMVAVRGATEE
jgi:hypothetical protein